MKTKIFLYRNIPYDVNIASLKARYNLKLHYLEEENLFKSKFKFIEDNKDNFDSESDDDDFFNNIQDQNKNRINKNLLEKKKLKRLKVYFKEEKDNFPIIKKQNHQLNEYFKNLYASPKIFLNINKNIKKNPINFEKNNFENLKNNNNNLKETKNSFFSNFNNKNNNTIIKSNSTSHFNFFKIKKYHSFIINKDKKINNVRNLNNIIDKYKNNKIYNAFNKNNILNNLNSSFFKSIHNKSKNNLLIRFNKLNNSIN